MRGKKGEPQRFCFQCCKLEAVSMFEGTKRCVTISGLGLVCKKDFVKEPQQQQRLV
jgi:hypothetical protein